MAKVRGYTYTVRGTGAFPVDMLRYDACWPGDSQDLLNITICNHERGDYLARRKVTIRSHKEPTSARWASFGWAVSDVRTW